MYQDLIVNDLIIYIGTLLVAAAMFIFVAFCFLGCLLAAFVVWCLQLAWTKLADAVRRQWAGWRGQPATGDGETADLPGPVAARTSESTEPAIQPADYPAVTAAATAAATAGATRGSSGLGTM